MEGIWVNLFEESRFFEEQSLSDACGHAFDRAPWLNFNPDPRSKLWRDLDTASRIRPGKFLSKNGEWPVTAYRIKFVGHRDVSELLGLAPALGIGYGHLSSFGSQVEVEKLIGIEEIPMVRCDTR
jgi:hypothetical protein